MDHSVFSFHQLEHRQFEELAATVLQEKFKIPLISFAQGRDGGRDAVARSVSIQLSSNKVVHDQTVVLQVKHTKAESAKLDEGVRNRLFKSELGKVNKLVRRNELDIYIAVTNYRIPAGQESKLVKMFRKAGCPRTIIVGKETLIRWIKESPELSRIIPTVYGVGGPSLRKIALYTAKGTQRLEKEMSAMHSEVKTLKGKQSQSLSKIKFRQTHQLKALHKTRMLVKEVKQEVCRSTESVIGHIEGVKGPVRLLSQSVLSHSDGLHALTQTVQKSQHILESLEKMMDGNNNIPEVQCSKNQERTPKFSKVLLGDSGHGVVGGMSDDCLVRLTNHWSILKEWRFLMRSLGLSEADVEDICSRSTGLKEQVFQALIAWRSKTQPGDQKPEILTALRRLNLHTAADQLDGDTSKDSTSQVDQ